MRYNPATESVARTIEGLASEAREAVSASATATQSTPQAILPDDLFAGMLAGIYAFCQRTDAIIGKRSASDVGDSRAVMLRRAMHYRPHQPLF